VRALNGVTGRRLLSVSEATGAKAKVLTTLKEFLQQNSCCFLELECCCLDYVRLLLKTLTVYSLKRLSTDEHAPAQAQTPSHPSRTITTSIEVEEPSQPSCCDRSTTLRSLSSRAGHHALCTCLPVKRG
jgi:hypothetical protein